MTPGRLPLLSGGISMPLPNPMPQLNWTSLYDLGWSANGCFSYINESGGYGEFHVRQCPCPEEGQGETEGSYR
jgi:hypothetical protein